MKNQKGFIPIIIILIVLIGFVGVYYVGTLKPQKVVDSPTPTAISTVSTAPTAKPVVTSDPTANWKTYTNSQYKFLFTYPKELTYLYDQLSGGNLLLQNFDGSKPRKELDSDFQFVLTVSKYGGNPLEDYPKLWESEYGKNQTKDIIVGGVKAIKGFSGQKYTPVPTVWFTDNNTLFTVQLSNPKSTNEEWFDQILSIFKFTN